MGFIVILLLVVIAVLALAGLVERMNQSRTSTALLDLSKVSSPSGELTFRHPTPDDINQIVAIARQPQSMQASGWTEKTALDHEARLRSPRFNMFARGAIVGEHRDGHIIGIASIGLRSGADGGFSLGIETDSASAGVGYGTELMRAMIVATRSSTDKPIWVGTAPENHAMQAIMKRLGYEPEPGTQPHYAPNGTAIDAIWYRCGRDTAEPL